MLVSLDIELIGKANVSMAVSFVKALSVVFAE